MEAAAQVAANIHHGGPSPRSCVCAKFFFVDGVGHQGQALGKAEMPNRTFDRQWNGRSFPMLRISLTPAYGRT